MKNKSHESSFRKKRIIVILLVILLLITTLAYGFMLGTKYAVKNSTSKEEKSDVSKTLITKEDIENFLSLSVSGNPNYNLILFINNNYDDEIIFSKAIQYLLANNKYTKSNDNYIFNQSDIKEVAKKYLMKDNFEYISTNSQFTYNSASKTFSSKLQFDIYGFNAVVTKKLENYNVDGNKINANYKVTIASPHPETGEVGTGITYSYTITLEKTDDGFKIINIVNN